jgi:hypothetical protein
VTHLVSLSDMMSFTSGRAVELDDVEAISAMLSFTSGRSVVLDDG